MAVEVDSALAAGGLHQHVGQAQHGDDVGGRYAPGAVAVVCPEQSRRAARR